MALVHELSDSSNQVSIYTKTVYTGRQCTFITYEGEKVQCPIWQISPALYIKGSLISKVIVSPQLSLEALVAIEGSILSLVLMTAHVHCLI